RLDALAVETRSRRRAEILEREASALRASDRAVESLDPGPLDAEAGALLRAPDRQDALARQLRAGAVLTDDDEEESFLAHRAGSSGRLAKRSDPMRTRSDPSSIAVSKSSLIPIDRRRGADPRASRIPARRARSASPRNAPRAAASRSGSAASGAIV